jgi:hypothetical protein
MMTFGALALAVAILAGVTVLLLKRQLREKYAVMWLIIGIAVLVLAIAPGLLDVLTAALGFQVPANLLFTLAIFLLLAVALHLSWELTKAEEEIRRVAEEAGIAELAIKEIQERLNLLEGDERQRDADPRD